MSAEFKRSSIERESIVKMNNNLFQAKKSLREHLSVAILKTQLKNKVKLRINFHLMEWHLQAICSKPNTSSTKNESSPLLNIFATFFVDHWKHFIFRRGIWPSNPVLGWVFELNFGSRGREFEQLNLQKFKCPGHCPGGGGGGGWMLMLRINRRITWTHNFQATALN